MTTKSAPYHAQIYYESQDRVTAERLHQECRSHLAGARNYHSLPVTKRVANLAYRNT
jgi:aromatic ring-cleaving dioxygenase